MESVEESYIGLPGLIEDIGYCTDEEEEMNLLITPGRQIWPPGPVPPVFPNSGKHRPEHSTGFT